MNIKQLLEWRKQCYFCNKDLDVFPEVYGLFGEYSFKDEIFEIKSASLRAQINMESGELIFPHQSGTTQKNTFLKMTPLILKMKCIGCQDQKYSYKGELKNLGDGYVQVGALYETIIIEDMKISQVHIETYLFKREAYLRKRGKLVTVLPLIDLDKIDPNKLKDKLKTYLTFS